MSTIINLIFLVVVLLAFYVAWQKRNMLIDSETAKKIIVISASIIVIVASIDIFSEHALQRILKSLPENIDTITINPIAGTSFSINFAKKNKPLEFSNFCVFPQILITNNPIRLTNGEILNVNASGLVSTFPHCDWYSMISEKKVACNILNSIRSNKLYSYDGTSLDTSNTNEAYLHNHLKLKYFNDEHMPLWRTPDGESPYLLTIPQAPVDKDTEQILKERRPYLNLNGEC